MLKVRHRVNCIMIHVKINNLFSRWKIIEAFDFLSGLFMAPVFIGFINRALNIYCLVANQSR